ncbi:TniQ family protein [Sutcliffiella horikoshii]|uniref:TniQ family protein n=1 Tax=Sutcliffiella horikoshii TaxID=79883 RepID=UPI00203B4A86|nr:TniQ family protein [Sutcliffiella horikoshii]MCM3619784.1 TniQ family protein [Sutcliffiella horikoshii]
MYITIDQLKPKLLLVEPPQFNESFQGYILRLTHLNLYDRVTWIYEFMSMTKDYKRRSSTLSQEMEALQKVTGLQQNQLQNLIFRRLNEKLFSEVMNFNQKHKCKICPKCLGEKGFYNGIWEIAFNTVCPEHQCLLIDKCPNCYTTISWNRNNIFTCLCKYDLRKCKTEVIHNQFLYKFSALINSKINNFSNEINHSNPLYELDVLSILRLINLIGLKIVFTLKHGGKIPYKLFENSELSVVVGKAFGVFEEWPKNFMVFLDNLKEDNENGSRGIMKDFGKFYQSIKSYDEFDFLFNAFEYYVFQNKDRYISPSFSRIFKKGFDHFDYITGTEAANSLGLKLYSIQELVKKQDLNGIINENKHFTLCLVNKSSVDVLKYKMKNWYSTRRARELLNINEHVFLGFISFFEYIEIPYKSGAKRRYFKPEVIDEVLTDGYR